jgi:ribosomal protein L40E
MSLRSSNFAGNSAPLGRHKKGGPEQLFSGGDALSNCSEDIFVGNVSLDCFEVPSEDDDCGALMDSYKEPENEAGITVKGAKSSQKFTAVHVGALESAVTVFNLALKGFTKAKKKVSKPRTVKSKKICDVCGKKNPFNAEYCMTCSNALDDI